MLLSAIENVKRQMDELHDENGRYTLILRTSVGTAKRQVYDLVSSNNREALNGVATFLKARVHNMYLKYLALTIARPLVVSERTLRGLTPSEREAVNKEIENNVSYLKQWGTEQTAELRKIHPNVLSVIDQGLNEFVVLDRKHHE